METLSDSVAVTSAEADMDDDAVKLILLVPVDSAVRDTESLSERVTSPLNDRDLDGERDVSAVSEGLFDDEGLSSDKDSVAEAECVSDAVLVWLGVGTVLLDSVATIVSELLDVISYDEVRESDTVRLDDPVFVYPNELSVTDTS